METRTICENGLNVSYTEDFYPCEKANLVFEELYRLDFKEVPLKIGSKSYTPLRKVCAFSDDGLCYKFSGATIQGDTCTPLILRLKEDVEALVGIQFNYVLVNLYQNGHAKIGAHMDNESDLNPEAPIAALSFGAKRKLIFHRSGYPSVTLPIDHGSLYVMNPPTNSMWKHSLPPEFNVQEPRISLTFRQIRVLSENPPKKRKLQHADEDLPENDWLQRCLEQDLSSYDIITIPSYFELSTDVQCAVKVFNGDIRVDIRKYKCETKRRIPTKEGVVFNLKTWYYFCEKVHGINLVYSDASFIANNQLLALNLGAGMHLQQMECAQTGAVHLKDTFIVLSYDEVNKLLELEEKITKCLIETLWIAVLPRKISSVCHSFTPLSYEQDIAFKSFLECLESNIGNVIKNVFQCQGCIVDSPSQLNHDCMYKSRREKFYSLGWRAWLLFNVDEAAKDISKIPSLNLNTVKGLTVPDYERLLFVDDDTSFV